MRIVSLAPSATETVQALGYEESLVATTSHTPDHPDVGEWLNPDIEAVASYDPDLVLMTDALQESIDVSTLEAEVIHVDPRTLEEVYESIRTIGAAITDERAARDLVSEMKEGFAEIATATPDDSDRRPVVYCEEWSNPPMAAGNWVTEIVDIAGGEYPFLEPGDRSQKITKETVEAAGPDYVILHICGDDLDTDPESFAARGWECPAVTTDNIVEIDDELLNQPGPDLVNGARTLAEIFHEFEMSDPASVSARDSD